MDKAKLYRALVIQQRRKRVPRVKIAQDILSEYPQFTINECSFH